MLLQPRRRLALEAKHFETGSVGSPKLGSSIERGPVDFPTIPRDPTRPRFVPDQPEGKRAEHRCCQ